jgi:superfamily II DNA/RNA helicase
METLDAFKTGKLKLLIASDVAARGLDIPAVSHVFNFDVPTHAEDYIHRIGRTGRAGRSGTSITLATPADGKYLDAIQHLIQRDIPVLALDAHNGATNGDAGEAPSATPRHRGRRGAARNASPADSKPADSKPADNAAPKPEREPRGERPGRGAPAEKPKPTSPHLPGNPFGDDGPVPAFLLRSYVRSE